jgi:hypothetical protein
LLGWLRILGIRHITLCDCRHTGVSLSAASDRGSLDIEGSKDSNNSGKGKEFHLVK